MTRRAPREPRAGRPFLAPLAPGLSPPARWCGRGAGSCSACAWASSFRGG